MASNGNISVTCVVLKVYIYFPIHLPHPYHLNSVTGVLIFSFRVKVVWMWQVNGKICMDLKCHITNKKYKIYTSKRLIHTIDNSKFKKKCIPLLPTPSKKKIKQSI